MCPARVKSWRGVAFRAESFHRLPVKNRGNRRRVSLQNMRDSKTIGVIAGMTALGAWGLIYLTARGGFGPGINPKPHEAAGYVLAQQALTLLKPGAQITVIARDTSAFKNPASDILLNSFRRTIQRSHASIGALQLLQVDPLRSVEVPAGDFFELIRKTPKGSVIVSLMGPPLLSETQRKQLGEINPAIVAFCSGSLCEQVDLSTLFDQGLLHAAVVSRHTPAAAAAPPGNLHGWFDQWFIAVTAANVSNIPLQTQARQN